MVGLTVFIRMKTSDDIQLPDKTSIEKAGQVIRTAELISEEYKKAFDQLSKWANLYAIPLKHYQISIKLRLFNMKKAKKDYLIGQRLKRMPSIIGKIRRFPDMKVTRMQDVGGLRIVVKTVDEVNQIHQEIVRNRKKDEVKQFKNYITQPKNDGYRGIHQVFRYSDSKYPKLRGFNIEVQIRTELQHCWATAVETLGMINLASYKTGEGDEKSRRFFLLASGVIALKENCPVPEVLKDMTEDAIRKEMIAIDNELQIISKLGGVVVATPKKKIDKNDFYYLLDLKVDPKGKSQIKILSFSQEESTSAEKYYRQIESETQDDHSVSILLIRADNFKDIRKAYPNYFLDVKRFLLTIREFLGKSQ